MIFLRINCPNIARRVASAVWAFQVVTGVSRQIKYDWLIRYTIWYDAFIRASRSWRSNSQLNLLHGTKRKKSNEETKNKNLDAQKKRSVIKSVESVLRPEGSQWWERFVIAVGLEPGVNERGTYGWREWWVDIVRQELIRRWDSERELLRSAPESYTRIRWNNAK